MQLAGRKVCLGGIAVLAAAEVIDLPWRACVSQKQRVWCSALSAAAVSQAADRVTCRGVVDKCRCYNCVVLQLCSCAIDNRVAFICVMIHGTYRSA